MSELMRRLLSTTAMVIYATRFMDIRVGPNEMFKTIQAAVDYASKLSGQQTIFVAPGVYNDPFSAPLGMRIVGDPA